MVVDPTGKICETEHEAVCDELRAMMVSSDVMNAASASLFLVWLVSEPQRFGEFRDLLTRVIETDPRASVTAAPAVAWPAPGQPFAKCKHDVPYTQYCPSCVVGSREPTPLQKPDDRGCPSTDNPTLNHEFISSSISESSPRMCRYCHKMES